MAVPRNAAKMLTVEVKKALDCSRIYSVTEVHEDLGFLVSGGVWKATHLLLFGGSLD